MKLRTTLFALSLGIALGLLALAGAAREDDTAATSSITFVAKNLFSTANGSFHRWHITRAKIDSEDPGSGFVEVEVDVASIDTGIGRRDDHLRSADFFDVEKFPKATVRVHDVSRSGESESGAPLYSAKFDVQIRGVMKTLPGQFELTSTSPLRVEGSLSMNRIEFGIGEKYSRWNPTSIKEEIPVRFTALLGAPN